MASYIAVFDGLPIPKNATQRVGGVRVESFSMGGGTISRSGSSSGAGAAAPTPQISLVITDAGAGAVLFEAAAKGTPFAAARVYTDDKLRITILKANIASIQIGGQGPDDGPRMQCEVVGASIEFSY